MSLISVQEYIRRTFSPESAPHEHTVRRWVLRRELAGRRIGKKWYIDDIEVEANGNPLVAKILRHESRTA